MLRPNVAPTLLEPMATLSRFPFVKRKNQSLFFSWHFALTEEIKKHFYLTGESYPISFLVQKK